MELDTTKLSQAGSTKLTPHDNCTVLDLGTGSFPRLIELRIPGIDGARQSALWDGSLDLAVDDIVIADEYAGQSIWRISSMGGGDSGAGKVRVSKVWESDFGAVALQADATGQIEVGKLTGPDAKLEVLDTAGAQLRLTFEDAVKFADFTLDTDDNLTIAPSSTGIVKVDTTLAVNIGLQDYWFTGRGTSSLIFEAQGSGDNSIFEMFTKDGDGTDVTGIRVFAVGTVAAATNRERLEILYNNSDNTFFIRTEAQGTGTLRPLLIYTEGNTDQIRLAIDGNIGMGVAVPMAKLHIDQSSTVAAQPVAYFDQADISEEMRQFETTIGTGNAIEAAGLKLLTVTHYVKDTLPGGLTRYTPYGTISETGPTHTKSTTVTTQGLGANPDVFAFGFYEWALLDANLTQASTTQTFGTANISYAAHAFAVTGGAGSVDTGVVGLRVNGTSINDQGTRTTSDTETIIADITAVATDEYYESDKKWLGQVTYELFTISGSPTTFSLDFNYGLAKYDDWFNNDFIITDIECVGFAGANDTNFDIKLMHHQSSGWTYAATGFTPITAVNTIASLVTDHSTDDQLLSSQHAAWKRDNLSTAIDGSGSEGFLVFISSSANNAVEYLNLHIGVVF